MAYRFEHGGPEPHTAPEPTPYDRESGRRYPEPPKEPMTAADAMVWIGILIVALPLTWWVLGDVIPAAIHGLCWLIQQGGQIVKGWL